MGDKVPTISITVDEKPRRHSHQLNPVTPPNHHKMRRTNSMEKDLLPQTELRRSKEDLRRSNENLSRSTEDLREVRRSNSLEKNRRSAQMSSLRKPTVPDIPEAEQSEDEATVAPKAEKTESTLTVNYMKNSRKISAASKSSKISIERGYTNEAYDQSNGSSLHGSMASLPVMREQYWCCKKWTRLEKMLLTIVAILGVVIVGLIIALSVMGYGKTPGGSADNILMHFRF